MILQDFDCFWNNQTVGAYGSKKLGTGALYQGEQMCVSATSSSLPQARTFSSFSSPTLRLSLSPYFLGSRWCLFAACFNITSQQSLVSIFGELRWYQVVVSVQTRVDVVLSCCGVGTGESCCSISWWCVGKCILVEREGRGNMLPPKVDRGCVLTPFRKLL